jgi:hypothetical protein
VIHLRLALLIGMMLLVVALPIYANPAPVPLFNECPQVGQALGCSSLVDFGTSGSVNDAIQNNSASNVNLAGYSSPNSTFLSIHLTAGLGAGKSSYFTWAPPSDGGGDNKGCDSNDGEGKSCSEGCDGNDGEGKSCSEGCDGNDGEGKSCGGDDDAPNPKNVTPEPASIMLLGTGLVFLGGIVRRKLLA